MTPEQRTQLLQRRASALASYEDRMAKAMNTLRNSDAFWDLLTEGDNFIATALQAEEQYFAALPRVVMSRCPFDDQPLIRSFDPFGLDGPWWAADALPEEPLPCRHFCALTGALDFAGHPAPGGSFEAHVGPQVPFVLPRILEMEGVVGAISRVRTHVGHVAYTVAYFAERRPPPQELTADWPRTLHIYETQVGEHGWRVANDVPDFELEPWIRAGKLRWTAGEESPLAVFSSRPEGCPFVSLPGDRFPRVVLRDSIVRELMPDGRPVIPVE